VPIVTSTIGTPAVHASSARSTAASGSRPRMIISTRTPSNSSSKVDISYPFVSNASGLGGGAKSPAVPSATAATRWPIDSLAPASRPRSAPNR
jgi:hypothetical protein